MSDMAHVINVPAFDGRAGSFANNEEKAAARNQISATDPQKRAAKLLLRTSDGARKVCLAVGEAVIGRLDGVERILRILRGRFAPDAIDSIFRDMVKFMCFRRPDQYMDTYIMEYDMCDRKPRRA